MMRKLNPCVAATLSFGLLLASPASASTLGIPDSDSATLVALLLQSVKDSAQLGAILTTTQQALQTAQFTADAARTAVETVNEFKFLTQNPDEIFDASASAFGQTFPEVQAIAGDAAQIRASFSGKTLNTLNPFALQQFFQNVSNGSRSGYQTLIGMDETVFGLTKEHLVTAKLLSDVSTTSEAIAKETQLAMTPQSAAVLAAKAGGQIAVSSAVTATNVEELLRLEKANYMKGVESAVNGAAHMSTQFEGMRQTLEQTDPTFDPTNPKIFQGTATLPVPGKQ